MHLRGDILVGDQSGQGAIVTDHGELLDLVTLQDITGLLERRAHGAP